MTKLLYILGCYFLILMSVGGFLSIFNIIQQPLSGIFWPLILSSIITLVLAVVVNRKTILKFRLPSGFKRVLPFFILPILAVVGAEAVNIWNSNTMLMILLPVLSVIPITLLFTKWIPEDYQGLVIWLMSLSLILHRCLISSNLWGSDIINEYAAYRNVALNGVWNPMAQNVIPAYNTSLAVTVLPQMLSQLFHVDGFWIFKVVFPVILSLVPVAVFEILKAVLNRRIALLSTFLIMAGYTFYTTYLSVVKQSIAVFFACLVVLSMLDKKDDDKNFWPILFGIGVILSHYATAFLLLGLLIGVFILFKIFRQQTKITLIVCAVLLVFCIGWYGSVEHGAVIKQFLWMGHTTTLPSDTVLDPATHQKTVSNAPDASQNEAERVVNSGSGSLIPPLRYFYLVVEVLAVAGWFFTVFRWWKNKKPDIDPLFIFFGGLFIGLLGLEFILPQMGSVIALDRIYLISMIFLAPYLFTLLDKGLFKIPKMLNVVPCVILAAFLLLNTGVINEIQGKPLSTSIALSQETSDYPVFTTKELDGARWLYNQTDQFYYDAGSWHLFNLVNATGDQIELLPNGNLLWRDRSDASKITNKVPAGSYVFLRRYDLNNQSLSLGWQYFQMMEVQAVKFGDLGGFSGVLASAETVFDNGDCRVLRTTVAYQAGIQ